jgi:gas vesicle protein
MNNAGKIFIGFLTGLTAGAITGLLLAPEKGTDTRKLIADRAKTLSDKAKSFSDEVTPRVEKAFETVTEYANKVFKKDKTNSTVEPEPMNN